MDNRNQLIAKNAAAIASHGKSSEGKSAEGVLLVNPPVDYTTLDLVETVSAFTQDYAVAEQTTAEFGVWPAPQSAGLVIIYVPKERERRQLLIAHVAQWARRIWLVGELKGGVKAAAKQSVKFGHITKIDAARHCGLYELVPDQEYCRQNPPADLSMLEKRYEVTLDLDNQAELDSAQPLTVVTYPGVFSFGALDAGTKLLLQHLPAMPQEKVLDVGCGAGVLSAVLAHSGANVFAVDTNALALQATQATLVANNLSATVFPSNMLAQVEVRPHERFDVIVSNPPFHQGIATDLQPVAELISTAKTKLKKGGQLWLVANQFLPYEKWLANNFSRIEQVVQDGRFKIIKAII